MFALVTLLQQGHTVPKWSQRAQLGLNLGPSMVHVRSLSWLLNITKGMVSSQFHIIYEDFFENTRYPTGQSKSTFVWKRVLGPVQVVRQPCHPTLAEQRTMAVAPPIVTAPMHRGDAHWPPLLPTVMQIEKPPLKARFDDI